MLILENEKKQGENKISGLRKQQHGNIALDFFFFFKKISSRCAAVRVCAENVTSGEKLWSFVNVHCFPISKIFTLPNEKGMGVFNTVVILHSSWELQLKLGIPTLLEHNREENKFVNRIFR